MKFHCCRQWRVTSKPSRAGGAAKEGEIRSAHAMAGGEGQGVLLEESGGNMETSLGGRRGGQHGGE